MKKPFLKKNIFIVLFEHIIVRPFCPVVDPATAAAAVVVVAAAIAAATAVAVVVAATVATVSTW